jgi:DedD protein
VDQKHKQRIVGIIVLALLVLVFIPVLFTGSKRTIKKAEVDVTIPAVPAKPVLQPVIPAKTSQEPKAWVIKLASFSKKDNADKLVKKLQNKGFEAYINGTNSNKVFVYQVLVGPETDKTKAQILLKNLQDGFQLQGIIIEYKSK